MRHRIEFLLVVSVFCLVSAMLAVLAGSFGLSWDALNHHIYLGFISESPRWERDVAAAASQTYQYPYIYWPFYRLTVMGLSGSTAAAVWAVFQTLCVVPPVWVASAHLLDKQGSVWEGFALRFVSCVLAFTSIPVLSAVGGSANDLLASVPLLWAITLALSRNDELWRVALCGALVGISVALKFSNVLCLPLFALALTEFAVRRDVLNRLGLVGLAASVGFLVTYAPWGWQLWRQFGNPFFPHLETLFRG
jgi:hypothetical protein